LGSGGKHAAGSRRIMRRASSHHGITAQRADEDEPVRVVPHDPAWPARFADEKELLEDAIGHWITGGVHHVGSTAVPGLEAKPVIDILVGVESLEASRAAFAPLVERGYVYAPYLVNEMHWFCKPSPSHRTHHLHLVPTRSRHYKDELAFRDLLRDRPDIAAEYLELKRGVASVHRNDREAYTSAKASFIERALADATSR
jgi:GrpB-like predicted nucleotidyltransferase (UPF0157 family)